jgi:hypothetical protein
MDDHYGCIEIHSKCCIGWIIVMELRVLLIIYYLIQEMSVEMVLDVYVRGVKIKSLKVNWANIGRIN